MRYVIPEITIARNGLMRMLDEAAHKRLIYIYAPAGYGKSTTARLWVERTAAHYAWLNLDEYDNNPSQFCRRFVSALSALEPENGKLREILENPSFESDFGEFAIHAAGAFEGKDKSVVFVLDDLHALGKDAVLKLLPPLINRLEDKLIFLLISRAAPPGSFSDLVVKNRLAMLDIEVLRFSEPEIRAFFEKCGRPATASEVESVHASTDGWAIGIAVLVLSGDTNPGQRFAGEYLETYLKDHVWDRWDESTRMFMMRMSVVNEFDAGLCEALTERPDSDAVLRRLVRENAFLSRTENGYRFHDLFRVFLSHRLKEEAPELENELLRTAADWYLTQQIFHKATGYFLRCKDYSGVIKCIQANNNYSTASSNIQNMMELFNHIYRSNPPEEALRQYPALWEGLAYVAFLDGRSKDFESSIDQVLANLHIALAGNMEIAEPIWFLLSLDYRTPLIELIRNMSRLELQIHPSASVSSISQNLPMFHRSQRDFSEFVLGDEEFPMLRATFGALIGKVYDVIEDCIIAGLAYEKGNIVEAERLARSANEKIMDGCPAEIKFCVKCILAAALFAGGSKAEAEKALNDANAMIERENAQYLSANLRALRVRFKLWDGNISAAREWLQSGDVECEHLSFYQSFQHFTTARAYISTGEYYQGIVFLQKLLMLSESYARPLDVIETHTLMAIALWKQGKTDEGFAHLDKAVTLAYPYGYSQIFANEGAELLTMLKKIHGRTVHKSYAGEVPGEFGKKLYAGAMRQATFTKGLTRGVAPEPIKFTKKQKALMKLLCEGHTFRRIAEISGVKITTVKSNMELLYRKLDVPGQMEAIIKIQELGLLDE